MSTPIRFFYRGAIHEVTDADPTRTVLQHLREDLHCTGTKEGCNEGDCGACTVVVGTLDDDSDANDANDAGNGSAGLRLQAVNACIQFLPTLDGKALFTVEDLQQPDGSLHPVQQALVECHGSQCGFCTPGFAMSLWGMYVNRPGCGDGACAPSRREIDNAPSRREIDNAPSRREIDNALSGNLCRCTGYRPIIDAARRMMALPPVAFDRAAVVERLRGLQHPESTVYGHAGRHFHAPRTLDELVALRAAHPQAVLLAGSTDVGLWVTKALRDLGDILYLGRVKELRDVREHDGWLEVGAGVSLEDAYAAACRHYPAELGELWQRFASLPIRNAGTLGGNVANGSPIGDSMPWLIALGSQVVLRGPGSTRTLALEDFYLGYQVKDLRPDEVVQAVRVPLPRPHIVFRTYKVSKRYDQDISAVCAAFALELDGGTVRAARIACGGMAAVPKRAAQAERALAGRAWDEDALTDATAALAQDYAPLTDMRASSGYRLQAAQNLLRRFWLETRPGNPLPAQAVNAFAAVSP